MTREFSPKWGPYVPDRGDIIAFEHGPDPALFLKRVIGVPGDTMGPGPSNTILVNGRTWQAQSLLPAEITHSDPFYSGFKKSRVPPGQVFVIGDNLFNSFDSRLELFGPVTFDKIIGKPVMIYWSPETARIGCLIR